MKKVQCKVCGSTRIKRINDSLCECSICGRQYTMEEARQLVTEIAETLSPEEETAKESALQSARQYSEAGDTQNALQSYEQVLKKEPENEEALQAVKQIFAADNAPAEAPGADDAKAEQPEEQPTEAEQPEGQQGTEDNATEDNAAADDAAEQPAGAENNADAANSDDANNAKSNAEKTKKGKNKKTKEKTTKKKDKDVDKDVDRDVHRDIDIDRDRDIDIHRDRDIDVHRDKEVVVEKEKKVKEKGKGGRGRTALIIIIVAVVFIIAGIIIGIAVSNSSSSEENPTVVYVSGEDEDAAEAGGDSSSSGSSSEAGASSETGEETTAATAEGTTAAEGSSTGMPTADFVDYLQNEAGLEIFDTGREPDTEGSITIYYCGVNIHIEKSKGVKEHDSVLTFNIAERNDTGTVLMVQLVADPADVEMGLDTINDSVIFPVSSALSTNDLKTYNNEEKGKDYEGFRTKLNEAFENSTFDGDTHLIADLIFEFEKTDEDAVSIAVCNMYELADVYGN